jgi:hypothetical protein
VSLGFLMQMNVIVVFKRPCTENGRYLPRHDEQLAVQVSLPSSKIIFCLAIFFVHTQSLIYPNMEKGTIKILKIRGISPKEKWLFFCAMLNYLKRVHEALHEEVYFPRCSPIPL